MCKDLLIKGMIFVAGGTIGSLVTWKLVKTKYEKIADEEIESMREYYSNKNKEKEKEKPEEGISMEEIHEETKRLNEDYENRVEEEEKKMSGPEIIPPEESWEQDYPTLSLTYFEEDDVLADESNKIINNRKELVGTDFMNHFGEYEDDSVFVRNDDLQVYYEILKDRGSYADFMGID